MKSVLQAYTHIQEKQGMISLFDLSNALQQNTASVNFFSFAYDTKMAEITAPKKLGSYRRYETVLNKFKSFAGSKLSVNTITYDLLRKYELYLITECKNTRDTVSSNLSVIRCISLPFIFFRKIKNDRTTQNYVSGIKAAYFYYHSSLSRIRY